MTGGDARAQHLDLAPAARAAGVVGCRARRASPTARCCSLRSRRGKRACTDCSNRTTRRACSRRCARSASPRTRCVSGDYVVQGAGGAFPARHAELFLGNAGTAFRPLTAVLALCGGTYRLAGMPRMHERPIGDLVDALRALGADIGYLGREGYPPLEIRPARSTLRRRGAHPRRRLEPVSERIADGAAARGPARRGARSIGELISRPYVEITLDLMRRFGVDVERRAGPNSRVPAGARYRSPGRLHVEGDASSASYFLAAGALGGGPVRVEGVGRERSRATCVRRGAAGDGRRGDAGRQTGSRRAGARRYGRSTPT